MELTPVIAKSLAPTAILLLSVPNLGAAAMALARKDGLVRDRAVGKFNIPIEEIVQLCPNPDFQAIDNTVPCLNYTDPATPKGYGQRDTCISLEGSPLHVGSPQGISSVQIYGDLNCTLYKTNDCEPDEPSNGYVIPSTGESRLSAGDGPDDPNAIDDKTVAFRCRVPGGSPTWKYGHPPGALLA
ncbi:hypothetical protein PG985_014533 [Apiospora marii]|uniref:Uncharacterized protein n=1 Tax=Apiospora marii TaxID=335849 RepID=A0ABR1R4R1_9PEZI